MFQSGVEGMTVIYLHTKFHLPISRGSIVIAFNRELHIYFAWPPSCFISYENFIKETFIFFEVC